MQAKRININEGNDGASGFTTCFITAPTDPREEVNMHNIHWGVSVEPQDAGSNCQGSWFLILQRENVTQATLIDTVVNGESNNVTIIAMGVFSASNESPYTEQFTMKTSRNLMPGDNLIVQSVITGITAGLASNRVFISAQVTRK